MFENKVTILPNSILVPVPFGYLLTLEYNERGQLARIYTNYNEAKVEVSDKIREMLLKLSSIPNTIQLTGGTTWVEGVLHNASYIVANGVAPECLYSEYKDKWMNDSSSMFYAGNVHSLAAHFNGFRSVETWLKLNRFATLPSYVAPAVISDQSLETLFTKTSMFRFDYPLISGLFTFDNQRCRYQPLGISQHVVKSVKEFVDLDGYMKAELVCANSYTLIIHASELASFDISSGTIIYLDSNDNLIHSYSRTASHNDADRYVKVCPTCGNLFRIPKHGPVRCSDLNCPSLLLSSIKHFATALNLTPVDPSEFVAALDSKRLNELADVFDVFSNYLDANVSAPLNVLISAATPPEVCIDTSVFTQLVNVCGNNLDTLLYYLSNESKIASLTFNSVQGVRFKEWLSDSTTRSHLSNLLTNSHITPTISALKQFEGAPIFRNKKIYITGEFLHGDHEFIASIFRSYGAVVTADKFGDDCDCIVVGQTKQDIALPSVYSCPIFDEFEFFKRYEIDSDLRAANLL